MQEETPAQDEIIARIAKLEVLTKEIGTTHAWKIAQEEIRSLITDLDENWQNCTEETFREARVTKLALLSVANLKEQWEAELEELREQLHALQNPSTVQAGDFDNE